MTIWRPQTIKATRIDIALDRYRVEFEWPEGEETSWINGDLMYEITNSPKVGNEFWLGHLNLLIIDHVLVADSFEVALVNGKAYQRLYSRRLHYAFDSFYRRLILTLHVWGWANVPPHSIPAWEHVGRKRRPAR